MNINKHLEILGFVAMASLSACGGGGGGGGSGSLPGTSGGDSGPIECSRLDSFQADATLLLERSSDDGLWQDAQADADHVYWMARGRGNDRTIFRISHNGGEPEVVAELESGHRFVLDGNYLFVRLDDRVQKIVKDGSASETLAQLDTTTTLDGWIAVDDEFVYVDEITGWTCRGDGRITVINKATGEHVNAIDVRCPRSLTADGSHLYFVGEGDTIDDAFLGRLPADGGEPEVLFDALVDRFAGLVVNDTHVYFSMEPKELLVIDGLEFTSSDQVLARIPKSGGAPEMLTERCSTWRIMGIAEAPGGIVLLGGGSVVSYIYTDFNGNSTPIRTEPNPFNAGGFVVHGQTLFHVDEHSLGSGDRGIWSIELP